MKTIRRLILFFIVVIIGVPLAIGGAALIKDASPPPYLDQVDVDTYNAEEELYGELDDLTIQFLAGNQSISMDEQKINEMIYDYMNGFKDEKSEFKITDTKSVNIDSLWTEFKDEKLTTYALIHYGRISTSLTLKMGIKSIEDDVVLTLDSFKIGQLPLPKSAFSYLLNNFGNQLKNQYNNVELDYDKLTITVSNDHIQTKLEEFMDNDIIKFDSLLLENQLFTVHCELNPANNDAVVLQDTIDEFKSIIENDTLLTNVSSVLDDSSDPEQTAFKENLNSFTTVLKGKITNPTGLSDDEEEVFTSLQTSFQNLTDQEKTDVITAFEGSIDNDLLTDINTTLENLGLSGFGSISNLMLGQESSTQTNP